MARLILHKNTVTEHVNERRLKDFYAMDFQERMKKAFQLMRLSLLFKNTTLKQPQAKGIVLKFK